MGAAPTQQAAAPAPQAVAPPQTTEASAESPALPNFLGGNGNESLASHRNVVALITSANGGFTTLSSITDPNEVLDEQLCLART